MILKRKKPHNEEKAKPVESKETQKAVTESWIDRVHRNYGDVLYDLCQSLLWSSADAPEAYRSILRTLKRQALLGRYEKHERAWIFQIAFYELKKLARRTHRELTPAEQVMLDSNPDPKARMRYFDSYFHRLPLESQFVLLLRDKYGFPMIEIASALESPEESLKLQRLSAFRQLESWIWSGENGML